MNRSLEADFLLKSHRRSWRSNNANNKVVAVGFYLKQAQFKGKKTSLKSILKWYWSFFLKINTPDVKIYIGIAVWFILAMHSESFCFYLYKYLWLVLNGESDGELVLCQSPGRLFENWHISTYTLRCNLKEIQWCACFILWTLAGDTF